MDYHQARHIGEIIGERYNFGPDDQNARAGGTRRPALELRKIPRLLLDCLLGALAAIGWVVTLPIITHDGRALTSCEQSGG